MDQSSTDAKIALIREQARKDLLALNSGRGIDGEINRIFASSPHESAKPWPLCFTIVGAGALLTFVFEVIAYLTK
jgi:hypothetical protein